MLTVKELSDYLKVHENTIYSYIKKGVPFYKIGKRDYRFELEEVKKWLKENNK